MNLADLRVRFLTCMPLGDIVWTKDIVGESTQQDIVAATIRNEVLKGRPLRNSYASNFMKLFMAKIEEFGGEIYDVTFEGYGDVLTLPPGDVSYKHYTVKDKIISLQEANTLVAEGTTGLHTWEASQYLTEYIMANPSLIENRNVLELGSGLGLLGLSLCSAVNCASYILSDHHTSVLRKLQVNVAANKESMMCTPTVEDIDWEDVKLNDFKPQIATSVEKVEVILAADVTYDAELFPALLFTLKRMLELTTDNCCAFMACAVRNVETYDAFTKSLGKYLSRYVQTYQNIYD